MMLSLDRLPQELLLHIDELLDDPARIALRLTSKFFRMSLPIAKSSRQYVETHVPSQHSNFE
jgi:hypothetical protein